MEIKFTLDYVCPYSYVAKVALEQALAEVKPDAKLTYQTFELTEEPKPRVDTYNNPEKRKAYTVLNAPCESLGLDIHMPPAVVPRPYTRLAFEGYFYALEKGVEHLYNELVFAAYFKDEQDIGELNVLCEVAEKAGLDAADFRRALEDGTYKEQEAQSNRYAKDVMNVRAVPTIYINGEKVSVEVYTKEAFAELLKEME